MKTTPPETNPPKRLLYKGFTYILAARSNDAATWEKTLAPCEQLRDAVQGIVEDEHQLNANAQLIFRLWAEINEYFKLLLPR